MHALMNQQQILCSTPPLIKEYVHLDQDFEHHGPVPLADIFNYR